MILNGHELGSKALWVALLVGGALLASACGSSSPAHPTGAPDAQSSYSKPTASLTRHASHDVVSTGVITHRPLHGTGGEEINDDNPGQADSSHQPAGGHSNPCALVSRAETQAILGRPIDTPVEAPLGPTCIYQPVGTKNFITLTVEATNFAVIKPHIRNRTQIRVGGRAGYCGIYGQPTTFVPLTDGRVLNITAPCSVGRLLAVKALSRLRA